MDHTLKEFFPQWIFICSYKIFYTTTSQILQDRSLTYKTKTVHYDTVQHHYTICLQNKNTKSKCRDNCRMFHCILQVIGPPQTSPMRFWCLSLKSQKCRVLFVLVTHQNDMKSMKLVLSSHSYSDISRKHILTNMIWTVPALILFGKMNFLLMSEN